jgi:sucrose-6-phosphatase
MSMPLLLCTDLDRTLIPNGQEPESPAARPLFRQLVARSEITLAYVTGRHRALVEQAIEDMDLPRPDYVLSDVGTSLYTVERDDWRPVRAWTKVLENDWPASRRIELQSLLQGIEDLQPQEAEKQAPFKLSYYTSPAADPDALLDEISARLSARSLRAHLVWSVDDATGTGLIDLLPEQASKYQAIEFLMTLLGHGVETTVFAGDSGNDLDVLTSRIPSILVANSRPEVREAAKRQSAEHGLDALLYCARGGWCGMNGNYCAGILEGIAYFRPDLTERLVPPTTPEPTPAGIGHQRGD